MEKIAHEEATELNPKTAARWVGSCLLRLLLSLPAGLAIGMLFALVFGSITDRLVLNIDVAERAWWETAQENAASILCWIGLGLTVILGQLRNAKIDRYLLATAVLAIVVVVVFVAKVLLRMWMQSLGN